MPKRRSSTALPDEAAPTAGAATLADPRFQLDELFNEEADASNILPQEEGKDEMEDVKQGGTGGPSSSKKRKVISVSKVSRSIEAAAKRGVIYISRIPPHMKPMKLKQMLAVHGEVGRVYCAPEDHSMRQQRKQKGGNTGKNFTEGWVEFEDKGVAKKIARILNGQPMGGKRRSAYHFDLWCLKYLPKFKWDHLTEEITYQKAVREQRLEAEISAAKRERDFYLSRVDQAKGVEAIKKRKLQKATQGAAEGGTTGQDNTSGGQDEQKAASGDPLPEAKRRGGVMRHFGQRRTKADPAALEGGAAEMADDVLALISRRQ